MAQHGSSGVGPDRPASAPDSAGSGSWIEVLRVFLRLGLTAFGGPAAHTGLFRETLVRRLAWVDDRDFLDLVAATSVIPGPNSSELALRLLDEAHVVTIPGSSFGRSGEGCLRLSYGSVDDEALSKAIARLTEFVHRIAR